MLKVFRDNLKNLAPVLWVVIAVFVLLMFAYPDGNPATSASVAATVNGKDISYNEYQQAYRNLEDRFKQVYGDSYTPELARQIGLPMQALNSLVAQRILLEEAEKLGLQATDAEVRNAILEVPVFANERGDFDQERYDLVLRDNRLTPDSFEKEIRSQLLLEKFNKVLSDSVWISDAEAEDTAREETESAQIRYAVLSPNDITGDQPVTSSELESYFEDHRDDYRVPERRRIAYLSANNNVLRSSLEIPDADIATYYSENQAEFSRPEQVRARHILLFVTEQRSAEQAREQLEALQARVEAGENFADLARQYTEDEATKAGGGDLGFFERGKMTPQFESAAFEAPVGGVVGPVENQLGPRTGYHLIQVQNRRDGGVQTLEEASNRIRVRLLNDRSRTAAEEKVNEIKASLGDRVFATAALLEEFAQGDELLGFEITEPVDRDGNIPGIGRNAAFIQAAFAAEPGVVGEPVRIASGWALPTAFDIEPPRLPELSEVEGAVRTDLMAEKKKEAAMSTVREVLARTGTDGGIDPIAQALGKDATDSNLIRMKGAVAGISDDPEFNTAVLALDEGQVGGPFDSANGAVVFEVTTRNRFDPTTFGAEKESTLERLRNQRVTSMVQSIIERRRGEIKLNINPQLQESFELPTPGSS